jgi:hypothetical protein
MEWIESSQVLVRKEKKGIRRKIKPWIFSSFRPFKARSICEKLQCQHSEYLIFSQIAALGNLPKAAPVDRNASSPTIKGKDREEFFNGI